MSDYLNVCEKAARAGGDVLLEWQGRISPREKGKHDLVTEADLASQQAIQQILEEAFPNHDFLGEEDPVDSDPNVRKPDSDGYRWIVDPLDGTTNYVHQMQMYSVSVALEKDGQLQVGTIFDPVSGECFRAELGQGAFLNGERIKVSECRELSQSLVAASFPPYVPRGAQEVAYFVEVLHKCQALRRLGSCALNLCYLAAGRLDGYWATTVKTWDVAAGVLIVREAGGLVTEVDGTPFELNKASFSAAATEVLHRELVETLSQAK